MAMSTLSIIATAVSAIGSISQGYAQKQQAETAAKISEQQAARERQVAAAREEDYRRQASRDLATRRAALGASGVVQSTGSPLLGTEDFVSEVELAALRMRNAGEAGATRLEQDADFKRAQGRNAYRAGFFGAGSSLLTGISKNYGTKTPAKLGPELTSTARAPDPYSGGVATLKYRY